MTEERVSIISSWSWFGPLRVLGHLWKQTIMDWYSIKRSGAILKSKCLSLPDRVPGSPRKTISGRLELGNVDQVVAVLCIWLQVFGALFGAVFQCLWIAQTTWDLERKAFPWKTNRGGKSYSTSFSSGFEIAFPQCGQCQSFSSNSCSKEYPAHFSFLHFINVSVSDQSLSSIFSYFLWFGSC